MDIELVQKVAASVPIPVIASGGIGNLGHIEESVTQTTVDAIAMAHVLHYDKVKLSDIHQWAKKKETIDIRTVDNLHD
jgi:cyclase